MKRLPLLSLVAAALLLTGAGCFTTTVNVNTNTTASTVNNAVAEQMSITVTIDRGDASPVRTFTVQVSSGAKALAALEQAATGNAITLDLKDTSFGKYVNGIDGRVAEGNKYWQFRVNGKAASVGVDAYVIQKGDAIGFVYTE